MPCNLNGKVKDRFVESCLHQIELNSKLVTSLVNLNN
jgi:hypothetical protein